MKLCRQLHISEVSPSNVGVYSPFGHGMVFLPLPLWNNISRNEYKHVPLPVIKYLNEHNIVVENGFEERWLDQNSPSDNIRFNSMYLITTMNCNLRCKYCVVLGTKEDSIENNAIMHTDIGDIALDSFITHLDKYKPKEARITFYGGEPLLNKPLLRSLVPKIASASYDKTNPKKIQMVMITNGYDFDPMLIPLFVECGVGVCVSIDGFKHNHDSTRFTFIGKNGTYDEVVKNFKKYRDAGLSVGISTTVGTHNVQELPAIGEFFVKHLGTQFIEFQIPYQPSSGANSFWVPADVAAPQMLKTYTDLECLNATEGTVHRRVTDFRAGRIRFRDCGASGGQLVVLPDGKIGPCHSLSNTSHYFHGNVCDLNTIEEDLIFNDWAKRHPFNMQECRICPYVTLCGGGCPYNALMANGSIWTKDPQICLFMPKFVDWLLKQVREDRNIEKIGLYAES